MFSEIKILEILTAIRYKQEKLLDDFSYGNCQVIHDSKDVTVNYIEYQNQLLNELNELVRTLEMQQTQEEAEEALDGLSM